MGEHRMKIWCPNCVGENFKAFQVLDGSRRVSIVLQCTQCLTVITADSSFEMTTTQTDGVIR